MASELQENEVAIAGMAFRLPGIKTYEKLAEVLFSNEPIVPELTERIPKGYHGEFPAPSFHSENMNTLDAIFFGMNTAVLTSTDRTQMKVLELSFEALMDAGINPALVKDIVCCVYHNTVRADGEHADIMHALSRYHILGNSRSLAPNRISFHFDYRGSSVAVDSGYIGGMQALELGWRDIKTGRSDLAVITSANLFLDETITSQMNDIGWLSKDGNTRVFDNDADGYVRAEAAAVFILQPAKYARRIYAKLRHVSNSTAANFVSFQSPTKESWTTFLKQVYEEANISPEQIQFLEAYGSAKKDWDAAELNAIMEVLGAKRQTPLLVGSVKSNVGNAEGASDLVAIIKGIICLEHEKVPANRHYSSPNRKVPSLIDGKIKVADQNTDLNPSALVAVNGYSYGNGYGHCILEGFRKPKTISVERFPRLIPLSARIEDMFPQIFQEVEDASFDVDYFNLLYGVFSQKIAKHLARGYMILSRGEDSITAHQAIDETDRPLWLVFSGMGSQWSGMGRDLMKIPIAQEAIQKCHDILVPHDLDLINILTSDDQEVFKDNLNSFVGIAAVQIALVDLLNAMKIVPDGIIGHSVGEVGCAYADGSLDLEQTILAAYFRGKAVKDAPLLRGAMAAIGKGYEQIKNDTPKDVEVACHNSKTSSTISGLEQAVFDYVAKLAGDGVFAKIVEVGNIAFHSQFIAPAGPHLLSYMEKVIKSPKLRSSKWVSSSVHEANWSEEPALYASAEYFTNNLLNSVLFEETCRHVPENAILVEVAPHGLLQAILKRSFPKAVNIPLTSRSAGDNLIFLLQAIGKLYMAGVDPDVSALYPPPNFPVATKTNSLHRLFPWTTATKPSESTHISKTMINVRKLMKTSNSSLDEHVFRGASCPPLSYYLLLVWHTFYQSDPTVLGNGFCLRDLRIFKQYDLPAECDLEIDTCAMTDSHLIELTKNETIIASAIAEKLEDNSIIKSVSAEKFGDDVIASFSMGEIYDLLAKKGYFISKKMRYLKYVAWTSGGIRGKMCYTADWEKKFEALLQLVYLHVTREEDSFVTIKKVRLLEVAAPTESAPAEDLEVLYDIATNELSCPGVYMGNIAMKRHSVQRTYSVTSLLPYFNPPLQSLQEFINFCLQIVANAEISAAKLSKVVELEHGNFHPISPLIQKLSPNIKAEIIPMGEDPTCITETELILCGSNQLRYLETGIRNFVLVRDQANGKREVEVPKSLEAVSAYTHNEQEKLVLLKKKSWLNEEKDFVLIPEKELDLIPLLRKLAETTTRILLVGYAEPADGIHSFTKRIQSQTSLHLQWLFILDESAPDFSIVSPFYEGQLKKELAINVLINGAWSFVYEKQLSEDFEADNSESDGELMTAAKGEVMKCDSELSWTLPSTWEGEDTSAQVAAAYAMAYYCLVAKASTKPFEGILVTDGCSVMGQAALNVALNLTSRVYATVASPDEASKLTGIFPGLDANNIILHSDPNFAIRLQEKAGHDRPNIIYNLLDGGAGQQILTYVPKFSKMFHFGKEDIEENRQIGMYPFIRSVAFNRVSVEKIHNWHIDYKREVWQLVEDGIRSGVVKPLKSFQASAGLLSKSGQKVQHLVAKCHREHKFEIKPEGVYLVVGESSHVDIEIAEWLARRGARNILLYNPSQVNRNEYQRKINLLQLHREVTFQVFNESSIKDLLNDIKRRAVQLDAIFFIHLLEGEPSQQVSLMEEALTTELKHFVAISRNRRYTLKMHKPSDTNKIWTDIMWNTDEYLISQNMDVLMKLSGEHSHLSVNDDNSNISLYPLDVVGKWLPKTIDSYQVLGASLLKEPTVTELTTLGHKMQNCTLEVQPIIFFPGLEDDGISGVTTLAKNLTGPAFIARVTCAENSSILSMASSLIPAIMKAVQRDVYNLVGVCTGCALAMEVARLLEQKGVHVALMLVDNPVQYLKQLATEMEMSSIVLEAIAAESQEKDGLQRNLPWSLRLNHLVSSLNLSPTAESWVNIAASHINNQLSAIVKYDIEDLRLNGPLTVARSHNFDDQIPYRQICPDFYITDFEMEHEELVKSIKLAKLINKFTVLDDVPAKSINEVSWVPFENNLERHRKIIAKYFIVDW